MKKKEASELDVIIVGGGPAGLSAALILGRSRRRVLIFDTGKPRNRFTRSMHGYLTRDGVDPLEFLKIAHRELEHYNISIIPKEITEVKKIKGIFRAVDEDGQIYLSKKMLLATGLVDKLPIIKNIDKYYGKSVFHCPYCDAWEVKDKVIAAYGKEKKGVELALGLKNWSDKVVLVTNGNVIKKKALLKRLKNNNIQIFEEKITEVKGIKGILKKIIFSDGNFIFCDSMFFSTGYNQHSDLALRLKCSFIKKGVVCVDKEQQASIKGLYVAGDAAKDMQMVIIAAAEGLKAGVWINKSLMKKEIKK